VEGEKDSTGVEGSGALKKTPKNGGGGGGGGGFFGGGGGGGEEKNAGRELKKPGCAEGVKKGGRTFTWVKQISFLVWLQKGGRNQLYSSARGGSRGVLL